MSERKVVNKYYPPDFDPAKIPRRSKSQQQQINVRIMLAISIRCGTCGTYIYRGTKFNSRKEDVLGETYLGIEIFRFYIKCKECSAEIVLKTDPQKSGYLVEAGARRNFEPDEEEEEQVGDVMEIRRLASKREMDTLSGLDELKSLKARRARQSVDSVFESLQQQRSATLHELEEEEEEKDKQELDMFKRSRRICVDSLMLQPVLPKVDIFQGSRRDELQHKKRKPASYYYLSVPKKLPAKTQESTSNGLALLCQHYDSINDED